jgi:sugar transferase (PEP-CTERM/EpsH1 system associated)
MADLLFLVHRLPYPPNKGDKVRSYHLLRHLAQRHRVHLGTFIDDPEDAQYLPAVQALCAEVHASRLAPRLARIASLGGLLRHEPLSLAYYRDAALSAWLKALRARQAVDAVLVFSSSMAPYAQAFGQPFVMDFVDVDSAKWTEYAAARAWPLSWLYRREGRKLLEFERQVAGQAAHSIFAAEKEAALFRTLAPETADRVGALTNGVDAAYFAPSSERPSPYAADELPLVFMGAMDYWPNIDAVVWFATQMLPRLRQRWPRLRLHIVGRNPAPAVTALAGEAVAVTGTVADVRPHVQHAAVVVAPLRLARGIQNKVLEAMAMARPVVAALGCAQAIDARAGEHLLAAASADEFVAEVASLLEAPEAAEAMGRAARALVLARYGWEARLAGLDRLLGLEAPAHAGQAQPAREAA